MWQKHGALSRMEWHAVGLAFVALHRHTCRHVQQCSTLPALLLLFSRTQHSQKLPVNNKSGYTTTRRTTSPTPPGTHRYASVWPPPQSPWRRAAHTGPRAHQGRHWGGGRTPRRKLPVGLQCCAGQGRLARRYCKKKEKKWKQDSLQSRMLTLFFINSRLSFWFENK